MRNIKTATKFSRLKSISSIEDSYLETATGGVLKKKAVLKIFAIFTKRQLFWSLFLIKLQVFRSATLLTRGSNTVVFLRIWRIFIYFQICKRLLLIILLV